MIELCIAILLIGLLLLFGKVAYEWRDHRKSLTLTVRGKTVFHASLDAKPPSK